MSSALTNPNPRQPQQAGQAQQAHTPRRVDWRTPPVDIFENSEHILVVADLPGVRSSDLTVRVEQDSLLVEGHRQDDTGWRREFTLPPTIDAEKISAELKDGVLRLTLPRSERAKPRKIEIRS